MPISGFTVFSSVSFEVQYFLYFLLSSLNSLNKPNVLYVNTHDSVYKGISREIGDFGGGIIRTYDNFKDDEDKDKLCIVYQTKDYPSHPFAAHPKVDKKTVELLEKAFIEMPEELKKLLSIKEFIHTTSQEYDVIKKLNIK